MVPPAPTDPQVEHHGQGSGAYATRTGRRRARIPGITVIAACTAVLTGAATGPGEGVPAVSADPAPVVPSGVFLGGPERARGGAARGDTADVLEEARLRQRRFERFRRRRLPWTWGRGGPPCDERIGRYCLWLGDEGEPWEAPDEPAEVRSARRELLAHLDSALARAPGSGWLADQAIRYLVEAGRDHAALVAARTCRADRARCLTLEGFVRHHMDQHPAAERAFREALAHMPADTACRWRSLEMLYRDTPFPGYGQAPCSQRRQAEEWTWLLADPLWLMPGNDRLTEHFARRVRDRMQQGGAASPFGDPWGPDLREILLRYGWPSGFEQAHPDVYDATARRPAVAHYPHWGMRYLPPAPEDPGEEGRRLADWDLDPARPHSEHAPSYLRHETERLPHQLARFLRGDSLRLVGAWRLDPTGRAPVDARSGFFVASRRSGIMASHRMEGGGGSRDGDACGPGAADGVGAVSVPFPSGAPLVVGLEAYSPADSTAARARFAVEPPAAPADGRPALSDLLLTAPARDTVPAELAVAGRCARAGDRLEPGERLGLYWEVYPGTGGETGAETRITVTPAGGGVLRAVGEFLGLAGDREAVVAVSWREQLPGPGLPHRRSLVIRIPPNAGEGGYRLGLTVRTGPEGRELVASRRLEVRSP